MLLTTISKSALVILIASVIVFAAHSNSTSSAVKTISGKCRHVVDGDSFYLQGYKPQIRLWGVDAPERNKAGYQHAKDRLIALAKNKSLVCEKKTTDKYGRTVARCFLANNKNKKDISQMLIESKVAKEYCWFSKGFYGTCD